MKTKELLRGFFAVIVLMILLAMFWGGMGMCVLTGNAWYLLLSFLAGFLSVMLTPFFIASFEGGNQ